MEPEALRPHALTVGIDSEVEEHAEFRFGVTDLHDLTVFHLPQLGLEDRVWLSSLRTIRLNLEVEEHLIGDDQNGGIGVTVLNYALRVSVLEARVEFDRLT